LDNRFEYAEMTSKYNDFIDAPTMARDESSGRVAWDDRGNSVWEWQTAPGVYSRHADTQRVKALQIADLELLDIQARGNEHTFCVAATKESKDYPSRAGMKLPSRGNTRPQDKAERGGLIKRLMGR